MDMDVDWEEICKVFVVLGGGAATVALTPATLAALGFTSSGVAAGSIAAKLMSYFAIANGGGVAAGGLVATLQSWAMGGLTGAATGGLGGAGAGLGWVLSRICNQTGTH